MLFNSFEFAAFFVVVYALYVLSARSLRLQHALLLVASYFFYGCWDWRFLGLIWVSTAIDYFVGRALDERVADGDAALRYGQPARRILLAVSLIGNLGILGVFKYYDFFAGSAGELLAALGAPVEPRLLRVVLPVGISFYTFQTLSYTIDVYRGELRACRSALRFAVFVAFFPQLVAGPIVRARDFLPQLASPRRIDLAGVGEGGYLVLWGLFKKVVIAGNLAPLVDSVFASNAGAVSGGQVLVAVYAFAVQIYCDFSGYTDIARGCARMMGFELELNFNLPYFARNPSDFWRRWHISLSSWLRDYLYIPLGGNRKGPRRTMINLALTMLLGGLWHGAAWTFVAWGAYQGALLIAHRAVMPVLTRWLRFESRFVRGIWSAVAVLSFFQLVCFGWLIFRANALSQIVDLTADMLRGISLHGSGLRTLLFYAAPLLIMQIVQYLRSDLNVLLKLPAPVRGMAYALMFYGLVLFGEGFDKPFIYFQF
ncbi:MAG: MBOAT family protein [Phycisphaerales bacterium]|nr:MBOAT family protein [Phycisphaerales bacterium]